MLFQITIPIASNIGSNAPLDLGPYFSNIIGAALTVAALATLIYLVWGGISWITAGGEEKKIESARNRITGALIGLAVVAVSWAIFLVIDNFLGIGIAGKQSSILPNNPSAHGVCPCYNGGCASTGQVSQLTSPTDCRICTTSGWSSTGAPASCPSAISCGTCP